MAINDEKIGEGSYEKEGASGLRQDREECGRQHGDAAGTLKVTSDNIKAEVLVLLEQRPQAARAVVRNTTSTVSF
jgi:hypothetical protein